MVKRNDNSNEDDWPWPYSPPMGMEVDNVQGINYEMIGGSTSMNSNNAVAGDGFGGVQDNGGNGAFIVHDFSGGDGPTEQQYITALYGVETFISDSNEFSSGNGLDVWWFDDEWDDPGGWQRSLSDERFLTHYEVGKAATDVVQWDIKDMRKSFIQEYGMPVLLPNDKVTMLWEYTGGSDGEIAHQVWYEYIPITDDRLLREIRNRA